MRPDWTKPLREPSNLIDLSTNICYDDYVEREINSFLHSHSFSINDVADEIPVYEAISKYHNVPLTNITLGFGLGELYGRIVKAYEYNSFAIHVPTWEFASVACKIYNVRCTPINNIQERTDCNVLYVANPSGVTGGVLTKYTIENLASKYDIVIVDESYSEYSTINSSVIESINSKNIIVLKTLSKSLGVAGLRVGYAIANQQITKMLQDHRPSSTTTSLASLLVPKLFTMIPNHIGRMITTRDWLIEKYGLIPSNGNYVVFDHLPDEIKSKFKVRIINNKFRMTLTNIERIKNALGN